MERFRTTLSIRFYCRASKVKEDGTAPVEMGINCNGERFFCNLPRRYSPVAFEKEINSRKTNPLKEYLNAMEGNIRAFETKCLLRGKRLTCEEIKDYIRNGYQTPTENLGYLIDRFYEYIDRKDILQGVKNKYRVVVNQFLSSSGLTRESNIDEITKGVCRDFIEYLQRNYKNSTCGGMLQRFKCMMNYACDNNLIEKSPLSGIKIKRQEVKIETITYEEYDRIKALDLKWCSRLEKVRDLFLFSCGTGLAYCDTQRLTKEDFQTNNKGQVYISKERAKTGVNYTVVVLPDALEVAGKYGFNLPRVSNQRCNTYLKEIQDLARIKTNLTFHKARHHYARCLLNKYQFPMDIVAKCLGHTDTTMSRHYAKLFSTTVFDQFEKIRESQ